ncbi:MAG: excinuclease ABC subunit UvrC [Phycisphaerales bacterium]|nr:excinuclease ABC subunit UvrC [Phycisphaerales bacterium]
MGQDFPQSDLEASSRRQRLSAKARELPALPGVYLLKDEAGEVLYVGKASSLPDRVGSYFTASADHGPRKQPMLVQVFEFDTIECEGEWEARLLESRLIKDLRPPFNVAGLDDSSYPYVAITVRQTFPGIYLTREPADARFKGARILGPFTSGGDLRIALNALQRVYKFRTCDMAIEPDEARNQRFRPCLLHAIHQCSAPCANRISPADYRADIERLLRFLASKRSAALAELRAEMIAGSEAQDYERAARLRDQMRALERLDEREKRTGGAQYDWQPEVTAAAMDPEACGRSLQRALGWPSPLRCVEAIDIAHLAGDETVGSKVCFIDGRPFRSAYRRFRVRTATNDDYSAISEVVSRRYRDAGEGNELFPDLILIDGGRAQLAAAMRAFTQLPQKPPLVVSLAKREELLWIEGRAEPLRLSRTHLGLRLCQAVRDEAHRYAQHYHHLLRAKALLGPRRVSKKKQKTKEEQKGMSGWCSTADDGSTVRVKVVPRASRNEIAGFLGDCLKVRVSAAPEDGKANVAVALLLAQTFAVSVTMVTLQSGATQARKVFKVIGLTAAKCAQVEKQHR